jgi:hypothetical protein
MEYNDQMTWNYMMSRGRHSRPFFYWLDVFMTVSLFVPGILCMPDNECRNHQTIGLFLAGCGFMWLVLFENYAWKWNIFNSYPYMLNQLPIDIKKEILKEFRCNGYRSIYFEDIWNLRNTQ